MNVAEELTRYEPQIDRSHVERRVADWVVRIEHLYADITAWLPPGWRAEAQNAATMDEPLMRDFGVPPRDLPMLRLLSKAFPEADLIPRGLWIIGANGRVDLVRRSHRFVIVDAAEVFETSHWTIAPFFRRAEQRDLTSDTFRAILT